MFRIVLKCIFVDDPHHRMIFGPEFSSVEEAFGWAEKNLPSGYHSPIGPPWNIIDKNYQIIPPKHPCVFAYRKKNLSSG